MHLLGDGRFSSTLLRLSQFFRQQLFSGSARSTLVDYLTGKNAYFNRIAIKHISMRFFSAYSLFHARRFR